MKISTITASLALAGSLIASAAFAFSTSPSHQATIHLFGASSGTLHLIAIDDHYNKSSFYESKSTSAIQGTLPFGDSVGNEEAFIGAYDKDHYVANIEQMDQAAAKPHINIWALNFNNGQWAYYRLKTFNNGQPVNIDFPFIPQQYLAAGDVMSIQHGHFTVDMGPAQ